MKFLYLMIAFIVGYCLSSLISHARPAEGCAHIHEQAGFHLYENANIHSTDMTPAQRVHNAKKLAADRQYEPYLILLLMDDKASEYEVRGAMFDGLTNDELEDDGFLEDFNEWVSQKKKMEISSVYMAIRDLHENPSKAVLLAITTRLESKQTGPFAEEVLSISGVVKKSGETLPIRDVARKALVKHLGVDYEYDVRKWRRVIMNLEN